MTDPGDLGRLHDVVAPTDFPLWPLAPGIWILAVGLAALLLLEAWRALKRYRANAYRRVALKELDALNPADTESVLRISTILKRVALVSYPRERVASRSGEAWARFIIEQGERREDVDAIAHAIGGGLKAAAPDDMPAAYLIAEAKGWVRHHRAMTEP